MSSRDRRTFFKDLPVEGHEKGLNEDMCRRVVEVWGVWGSSPRKKFEFLSSPEWISCNFSAIFYYIFPPEGLLLGGDKSPSLGGANIGAGGAFAPPVYMLKKALRDRLSVRINRWENLLPTPRWTSRQIPFDTLHNNISLWLEQDKTSPPNGVAWNEPNETFQTEFVHK